MKSFLILFAFFVNLFAIDWAYSEPFSLRKDEFAVFEIDNRVLTFRWSLFHNKGLVCLIKYDHFPYQTILYDDYKLNAIKIPVKTNRTTPPPLPYMTIVFESFDSDRNLSNMRLYLFDELGSVKIAKASDERN
ncbi:MAG: hypothetical protein LBQ52_03320 [Helicobacteraceae bacterium]|jgi:hypothetical protein|nr:hypothetical protein [Helicobacteraceae bacterium]